MHIPEFTPAVRKLEARPAAPALLRRPLAYPMKLNLLLTLFSLICPIWGCNDGRLPKGKIRKLKLSLEQPNSPGVFQALTKSPFRHSPEKLSQDTLDILVSDYADHGLPFPPEDAKLVRRKLNGGVVNGVQQFNYRLAFFVERNGKRVYWKGCGPNTDRYSAGGTHESASLDKTALSKTEPAAGNYWPHAFQTFADLALAVQCQKRGWNDLARALLERSNRRLPTNSADKRKPRPEDPRKALAALAWNRGCNQFARGSEKREVVLQRMKKLSKGKFGLDTKAHKNVLADMEKTLAKTHSKPETPEGHIDALVDLSIPGYWPVSGHRHWVKDPATNAHFKKLRNMGLEAVPVLIKHLRDYRMTRSIQTTQSGAYTWHIRIADVVGVLLNGLYKGKEEFAFDFLETEGRGKCLDERHVLSWWKETQGAKALDYLVENAITEGDDRTLEVNEAILHALGNSYPHELAKLVERYAPKLEAIHEIMEALSQSKASDAEKARLYLMAVKSPEWRKRAVALKHLLQAKHEDASSILVNEFKEIPKTPKEGYWVSSAAIITRLVRYTDDPAAWKAVSETARRVDVGQRLQMIQSMGGGYAPDHPRRLEFLIGFLDDKEIRVMPEDKFNEGPFTGPSAGFTFDRLVVGDYAALRIATLLELDVNADATWGEREWKLLQTNVRKTLAEKGLLKEDNK